MEAAKTAIEPMLRLVIPTWHREPMFVDKVEEIPWQEAEYCLASLFLVTNASEPTVYRTQAKPKH